MEDGSPPGGLSARRALMTYAFVSHSISRSRDILEAICPLFGPILRSFGEFPFDANQFSQRVREYYGIDINPMAVEELVPRLERLNLLRRIASPQNQAIYFCGVNVDGRTADEERVRLALERILSLLKAFPRSLSPVSPDFSDVELEEGLLEFLVQRNLNPGLISDPAASQVLSPTERTRRFRAESIQYVISRFVVDLEKKNPELIDDIAQINAAAMVSEVVLDLRKPPSTTGGVGGLRVILDAPLAMAVMGLSGEQRRRNTEHILSQLRALRCHVGIFDHSVAEIEDILFAVMESNPALRTGPLGDALRDEEVTEDEVRVTMADVKQALRRLNIFLERVDIGRDVGFFDERMIANLKAALAGWTNETARNRDARSVAYIARAFGGASTPTTR
jgi:hypothetical protein